MDTSSAAVSFEIIAPEIFILAVRFLAEGSLCDTIPQKDIIDTLRKMCGLDSVLISRRKQPKKPWEYKALETIEPPEEEEEVILEEAKDVRVEYPSEDSKKEQPPPGKKKRKKKKKRRTLKL